MADKIIPSKICTRCKNELQLSLFNKNKSKPDGLSTECRQCVIAYNRSYYPANKQRCNKNSRSYYLANSEKCRSAAKVWAEANPDKVDLYRKAWRLLNKDKIAELSRLDWESHVEQRKATKRNWRQANPAACLAMVRKRQARIARALPAWADLAAIKRVYEAAKLMEKLTGGKWHVDHYYPLKGKLVSGLHVVGNLRLMPAHENQRKSNKHPEE